MALGLWQTVFKGVGMQKAVVLDIEASGLEEGSFPIEIAWIGVNHDEFDTFFIKPERHWTHWDEQAESIHGLSRSLITRTGISCEKAVSRLDANIVNLDVYSDAPEWDGYWLDLLYSVVEKKRTWTLKKLNLNYTELKYESMPHRALADAERLSRFFTESV